MIRGPLLRIYKTLRTWVGIVTGMALFICFYAGALTMFMDPLSRWAAPANQVAQNWPAGARKQRSLLYQLVGWRNAGN